MDKCTNKKGVALNYLITDNTTYFEGSLLLTAMTAFMNNLEKYSSEDLECIRFLPNKLKTLLVRKFICTTYYSAHVDLAYYLQLSLHPGITILNLSLFNIDDNVLQSLTVCKKLEVLHIDDRSQLLSAECIKQVMQFPDLSDLRIMSSDGITDEVVAQIAKKCPKLQKLNLFGSRNITNDGFAHIMTLQHLIALDISGSQITEEAMAHAMKATFINIVQDIRLDHCRNLKGFDFTDFVSKTTALTKLSCVGCSITDNMSDLKNLKQINWTIEW